MKFSQNYDHFCFLALEHGYEVKSPPGGEGIESFAEGRGVYRVVRTWGVIVTIRTFFKAKTAFCEYWTSIKIKISLTSVSWNQNKNGTGAKTTAKNDVFIGL